MNTEKKQSAHAVILNDENTEILLVKRRDIPVWVLPGGGVESGETPEKAAIREAEEETGLSIDIREKIGIYYPRNALSDISHIYECRSIKGNTLLTEETQDIQWFPLAKLPLMPPPYPEWLEDAYVKQYTRPYSKKVVSVNYYAFIKNCILHPILMIRFLLSRIGIHLNKKPCD